MVTHSKPLRVVFAGTPNFSLLPLQRLCQLSNVEVLAVYSQPDRPFGRGREMRATPVKQWALEQGIMVKAPMQFDTQAVEELISLQPDLMVVAAYGLLLPQAVLDVPRFGCINIHASQLPRWRGAAPIQAAILAGDETTGVDIMQMEAGLDTGGILYSAVMDIGSTETADELTDRLAHLGADALATVLEQQLFLQTPVLQDDALACYAHKINKQDARIDWNLSADQLQRHVRAYWPWPGAFCFYMKKRVKIRSAQVFIGECTERPGTVIRCGVNGLDVACGDGVLRLVELQLEGKKMGQASEWYLNSFIKPLDQFS